MAWTDLPTDYQDAAWNGSRKFNMTKNPDGSYSFEDVTEYTQIDKAYRSALDINQTNAAINTIMSIFEGSYKLLEPTNISIINGDTKAYIKWTDPENGTREDHTTSVQWAGTLVVRKTGSAPKGHNDKDAVVVVDERIRNQYKMSPFTDENLVNGTTYYYGIYPYTSEGKYTDSVVIPFKPSSLQAQLSTITVTTRANATVTAEGSGETVYGTADSNGSCVLTVNYIDRYAVSAVDGNWKSATRRVSVVQDTTSYTVTITTALPTIVSWSTGSDADIVAMVEAADRGDIDLSDYWHVGDTRTIRLPVIPGISPDVTHSQQYIDLVLLNRGGKELTEAVSSGRDTCSFVVGMKDCFAELDILDDVVPSGATQEKAVYWGNMKVRTWMNETLYEYFPSSLKPIFKQFKTPTISLTPSDYIHTVDDYFTLFAITEIDKTYANRKVRAEEYARLSRFEYYEGQNQYSSGNPFYKKLQGKGGTSGIEYYCRERWDNSTGSSGWWDYINTVDNNGSFDRATNFNSYHHGISFYGVI